MIDPQRRLTREELLQALQTGWGELLAHLEGWPETMSTAYARSQGFARVEDVLAHVHAWWGELLREIPAALRGEPPIRVGDVDAFNASAVERAQSWTCAHMLREATARYHAVVDLLASLSDADLWNEEVYSWAMGECVTHWDMHRPQRREEAG
jgi:hypothetical protein